MKSIYIHSMIPLFCSKGDDGNYGSSATKDIEALQLLSRRIHFGKFVAEAKFNDPELHENYVELIQLGDSQGILELLTHQTVEDRLLKRVKRKALFYGQDSIEENAETTLQTHLKIPLDVVADLYKDYIIPLTKEVEVLYLLERLSPQAHF